MKIANFGVEEWLNKWEKKAVYDIAQSSIEALTLDELVGLDGTSVSKFFEKRKTNHWTMAGSKDQMFSNRSRFSLSNRRSGKHLTNEWSDWC